jgi:hypothetical protein
MDNQFNIHRSGGAQRPQGGKPEFNVDPELFGSALADALAEEEAVEQVHLGADVQKVAERDSHRPPIHNLEKPLTDQDIKDLNHKVNQVFEEMGIRR